jgi:hypothetical protein
MSTTRHTADILDNVFTYTESALALTMARTRPELYAEVRDVLKYKGASKLNKRDLAIIIVDAYLAEEDVKTAKAIATVDKIDATPKLHECETLVVQKSTGTPGRVLGHTFDDNNVLRAHVQFTAGIGEIVVAPENEFGAVTMHPNREGHGYVEAEDSNRTARCVAHHEFVADANYCAFDAMWEITVKANETVAMLDMLDQRQMVDVMQQVVDNGREDLLPILDMIDASDFQSPDVKSSVPCVPGCEKCTDDANRCDECALAWLVDLYKITGDVKLNELPAVAEFDCYA